MQHTLGRAAENACYARGECETGAFLNKSVKLLNLIKNTTVAFGTSISPDGSSRNSAAVAMGLSHANGTERR